MASLYETNWYGKSFNFIYITYHDWTVILGPSDLLIWLLYRVRQQKPDAQNFNSKETFKKQVNNYTK